MDDVEKTAIIDQVTELVRGLAPATNFRPMYGGIVFELIPDDTKSRVGGVFA